MHSQEESFYRELAISLSQSESKTLMIEQKLVGGVESVVWDSSLVFAKYIECTNLRNSFWKHKRVLELGAGTGVCSLVMALVGANVTATDLPEALPLMRGNVERNEPVLCDNEGRVEVVALDWTSATDRLSLAARTFDLIVAVDCLYYEASLEPLMTTLKLFSSNADTVIYCVYEERDIGKPGAIQAAFIKEIQSYFDVEKVPDEHLHPDYICQDIHVLKLRAKQNDLYKPPAPKLRKLERPYQNNSTFDRESTEK